MLLETWIAAFMVFDYTKSPFAAAVGLVYWFLQVGITWLLGESLAKFANYINTRILWLSMIFVILLNFASAIIFASIFNTGVRTIATKMFQALSAFWDVKYNGVRLKFGWETATMPVIFIALSFVMIIAYGNLYALGVGYIEWENSGSV